MTLFSKITFDPHEAKTRRIITEREKIHAVIAAATNGRALWRMEDDRIYVVSDSMDADRMNIRLGGAIVQTTDYQPFLDRIANGTRMFSLEANPTRRGMQDRRLHPILQSNEQLDWLAARLEKNGAKLRNASILDAHALRFNKPTGMVTLNTVRYMGELDVTDETLFRSMLTSGIGRGRAYGLGMLLLAS